MALRATQRAPTRINRPRAATPPAGSTGRVCAWAVMRRRRGWIKECLQEGTHFGPCQKNHGNCVGLVYPGLLYDSEQLVRSRFIAAADSDQELAIAGGSVSHGPRGDIDQLATGTDRCWWIRLLAAPGPKSSGGPSARAAAAGDRRLEPADTWPATVKSHSSSFWWRNGICPITV